MASTSAPPPSHSTDSAPSSFTMIDRDLESIGAHCQYAYCHQLDFLPFRCESCRGTYCLEHRTEDGHACPRKGAWAAARRAAANGPGTATTSMLTNGKPTLATGVQCSDPACKTYIHTHTSVGVGCGTCGRDYCLKHRLPEDHKCSTLKPLKRTSTNSSGGLSPSQRAATALARLRAWGKGRAEAARTAAATVPAKLPGPRTRTTAPALNELKRTAKGDARVPLPKRVYLHAEAVAHSPRPSTDGSRPSSSAAKPPLPPHGAMFFSGDWSVGRLLDEAARGLQVENVNNRGGGEAERLRVFHVEGGRLLDFGEKVGECLKSGNTVVLLRGVGPVEEAA